MDRTQAMKDLRHYSEMLRAEQNQPRGKRMPIYEAYLELGVHVAQREIARMDADADKTKDAA